MDPPPTAQNRGRRRFRRRLHGAPDGPPDALLASPARLASDDGGDWIRNVRVFKSAPLRTAAWRAARKHGEKGAIESPLTEEEKSYVESLPMTDEEKEAVRAYRNGDEETMTFKTPEEAIRYLNRETPTP